MILLENKCREFSAECETTKAKKIVYRLEKKDYTIFMILGIQKKPSKIKSIEDYTKDGIKQTFISYLNALDEDDFKRLFPDD